MNQATNFNAPKPVKLGRFEITQELTDWEIVNEVGVGRWLGRVLKDEQHVHARVLTLQPALELTSPSRAPVLALGRDGQKEVGAVGGFNADYVLNQPSDHPIREIAYSSRQKCSEMSEDLRIAIFDMIADVVRRYE